MRHARSKRLFALLLMLALLAAPAVASADRILARLSGYHEVPAVSTVAHGSFRATINATEDSIDYVLTFSELQGAVTQAHIHFAQRAVNGSIVVWLCGTTELPGPPGTPACPESGSVTGTITAVQVVAGASTQQIAAGQLAEVIAAIRAGVAYANVHTSISPGGEIRGQLRTLSR